MRAMALLLGLTISAMVADSVPPPPPPPRRPFSAAEFEQLRQEIHLLPNRAAADARFAEIEPRATPPPRQSKIDHLVVLFMENRAFDHIFGCMLGDKPGIDGIPSAGRTIPNDPGNASAGTTTVLCGAADWVCDGGGGYSLFDGKFAPGANRSTYPYGNQSDAWSVKNGGGGKAVHMFNASQLPVKHAVSEEFGIFNKFFTSVPAPSTPNHLYAQSATSCGLKDNLMYSECGGATDTFPQLTVFDNLHLNGVNFSLYMNSSFWINGTAPPEPHGGGEHGSDVDMPDVAMDGA
jgi:phospholipase C